jgi:hypothetical protein
VLRRSLAGEILVSASDAFEVQRTLPHGHVAAVLGILRDLDLGWLVRTVSPAANERRYGARTTGLSTRLSA